MIYVIAFALGLLLYALISITVKMHEACMKPVRLRLSTKSVSHSIVFLTTNQRTILSAMAFLKI